MCKTLNNSTMSSYRQTDLPRIENSVLLEPLDLLLSILETEDQKDKLIIDIGIESRLIEELILRKFPNAYVTGICSSPETIKVANQKIKEYRDKGISLEREATGINNLNLPMINYRFFISIQPLSFWSKQKKDFFPLVYQMLEKQGLFLIIEQVVAETSALSPSHLKSFTDKKNKTDSTPIDSVQQTSEEYTRNSKIKNDCLVNIEPTLSGLCEVGFEPECFHFHGHHVVIGARKI
jgi:hypothetical protein